MRGPIDYIIVRFQEPKFDGGIMKELASATEAGTIAVLDVALVERTNNGDVHALELSDAALTDVLHVDVKSRERLVGDDDIAEVGELLEDGEIAGFLVIEQLWAKGLKQAIIDAGGTLLNEGRIHPEASKELDEKGDN